MGLGIELFIIYCLSAVTTAFMIYKLSKEIKDWPGRVIGYGMIFIPIANLLSAISLIFIHFMDKEIEKEME